MQKLINVRQQISRVIRMQTAVTQTELYSVCVQRDTLAMELIVTVWHSIIILLTNNCFTEILITMQQSFITVSFQQ